MVGRRGCLTTFALNAIAAVRPALSAREWANNRTSHVGKLDKAWDGAASKGWTSVSMKDDRKTIFPLSRVRQQTRTKVTNYESETDPIPLALVLAGFTYLAGSALAQSPASPPGKKPNILVIWGDDIGTTNVSAYSDGVMGYETPNIDRIAQEGLRFLHYYGEQSCTAGRAAFITGQHGLRTG
jgi:hypothetical protein